MTEQKTQLTPDVLISGTSLRLLALETTKSKWTTVLVGSRAGRYLIVEMPKLAGAPVKLDDGTRWAANFISRGGVYSFTTEVLGYTYRLVPLLFLEYPQEVSISNLRTEKRYPVNIPLTAQITERPEGAPEENDGDWVQSVVVDISEGGFMMASPTPLEPETVIEGTYHLPRKRTIENIQAVVRTCRGKPGGYFVGLAYLPGLSPETDAQLNSLIAGFENMPLRL